MAGGTSQASKIVLSLARYFCFWASSVELWLISHHSAAALP